MGPFDQAPPCTLETPEALSTSPVGLSHWLDSEQWFDISQSPALCRGTLIGVSRGSTKCLPLIPLCAWLIFGDKGSVPLVQYPHTRLTHLSEQGSKNREGASGARQMLGEFSEKSNSMCSFIESFNKYLLGASGAPETVKALEDLMVSSLAKVSFPWGAPVLTG